MLIDVLHEMYRKIDVTKIMSDNNQIDKIIVVDAESCDERETPIRVKTYDVFTAVRTLNYGHHGSIDITNFLDCFGKDRTQVLNIIMPVIKAFNGQPPCSENLAAFRAALHNILSTEGFSLRS